MFFWVLNVTMAFLTLTRFTFVRFFTKNSTFNFVRLHSRPPHSPPPLPTPSNPNPPVTTPPTTKPHVNDYPLLLIHLPILLLNLISNPTHIHLPTPTIIRTQRDSHSANSPRSPASPPILHPSQRDIKHTEKRARRACAVLPSSCCRCSGNSVLLALPFSSR